MTEKEYNKIIQQKIHNIKNDLIMSTLVYDWYTYFWDNTWNLENITLIGVANIIKSNSNTYTNPPKFEERIDQNRQALILKNTITNQTVVLMLPTTDGFEDELSASYFGFAIFDEIEVIIENNKWIITNQYDEQYEIDTIPYENEYNFIDFMPKKLVEFSKNCGQMVKENKPKLLIDLYKE